MNVKRLLQQHARNAKTPYAQVLVHYAMERFLHRLSLSRYAEKFFLKGGMLLMGMGATPARTTMDIDLLGRIDNAPDNILKVVQDIIRIKAGADEVQMSDKVTVSEIMLNAVYHGVRVEIPASVAGDPCSISIDIGFSDEIVPEPGTMDYPSLLEGMPPARIRCYSRESVVAEKWQSLVQLAGFSNRMKDYYDLWFLAHNYKFDFQPLSDAIRATFARRQTQVRQYTILHSAEYLIKMQPLWATYLAKLKSATFARKPPVPLPSKNLEDVVAELVDWLAPAMLESHKGKWNPRTGWKFKE